MLDVVGLMRPTYIRGHDLLRIGQVTSLSARIGYMDLKASAYAS